MFNQYLCNVPFHFLACAICLGSFENLTCNSLRLADKIVKPVDHRQPHTKPAGNCDHFDGMSACTVTGLITSLPFSMFTHRANLRFMSL